jgi:DNA polymerase-3 subunit delta'
MANELLNFLTEKQPILVQFFKSSIEKDRLSHAYLFEGGTGTGKNEMAHFLSCQKFCVNKTHDGFPCGECVECVRIQNDTHPNVWLVKPDGLSIKVDQIRELKKEIEKTGFESSTKVFIIEEAEKMSVSAANSLLKFLEEPDGEVMILLTTTQGSLILPTIKSRVQSLTFRPIDKELFKSMLESENIQSTLAHDLSLYTNDKAVAVSLAKDEEFMDRRREAGQFYSFIKEKKARGFIYIQKNLVKRSKDKQQQEQFYKLLFIVAQNDLKTAENKEYVSLVVEKILEAHKRFKRNVTFQNSLEFLTLSIFNL